MDISLLQKLRRDLHRLPDLSGREEATSRRMIKELENFNPDDLKKEIGGTGVLASFLADGNSIEKQILFRAELDAVAIDEETGLPYSSENRGVMHACGHDGHMAILIGLAAWLEQNRPENIHVHLLFQPAEETGEGASNVLADPAFKNLSIDHAFALHNLPGYTEKSIYTKKGPFACASTGVEITIKGSYSHAAYPGQGLNPARTVAGLIQHIETGLEPFKKRDELNNVVATYIKMGEPAFGISPGKAVIGYTLRSSTDDGLQTGLDVLEKIIDAENNSFEGKITRRYAEPFSATINSGEGVDIVKSAASKAGVNIEELKNPFPWSEDFGEFRKKCPITIFGLGAGKKISALHSETYDFNDALIPVGVKLFSEIVEHYSAAERGDEPAVGKT